MQSRLPGGRSSAGALLQHRDRVLQQLGTAGRMPRVSQGTRRRQGRAGPPVQRRGGRQGLVRARPQKSRRREPIPCPPSRSEDSLPPGVPPGAHHVPGAGTPAPTPPKSSGCPPSPLPPQILPRRTRSRLAKPHRLLRKGNAGWRPLILIVFKKKDEDGEKTSGIEAGSSRGNGPLAPTLPPPC